jgi:O-antigen/teichoic acid export membrane protein
VHSHLLHFGTAAVIILKNAFWLSVCRLAADFSSLVLFAVISRDLGPAATGQYSYAFALGTFIAILAASGLDQYGVREYARLNSAADRSACWRGMLFVQSLQLLTGLVVLLMAVLYLGGKNADPVIILELTAFLIGWGLSRTLFVPAIARQAMVIPAFMELACRSAAALSALALCLLGVTSLRIMLIGFPIAGVALVCLALTNAAHHGARFNLRSKWTDVASITRNTVPLTFCEALGQFYIRADLLLIVQLLGSASAGWYAADLKMVEVGVMPLILLGTAVYPSLSRSALQNHDGFVRLSEEYLRGTLFVSGWLSVGMYCLIPMVIPALFGDRFDRAVSLLPMFSILALTKGLEIALYRLLYAARRQNVYLMGLIFGAVLIVALNLYLIPEFGSIGAIAAVVLSTALVDLVAIANLRADLPLSMLAWALARLGLALACTALIFLGLGATDLNDWWVALAACLAYPLFAAACGLMPHPRRSLLFA